jgi:hypothetical protein
MADRSVLSITLPAASNAGFSPGNQRVVLAGVGNGYANGKPERLVGRDKLEDDIGRIIQRVTRENAWLQMGMTASEFGTLSELIRVELENPVNWWFGQSAPISVSKINIDFFGVTEIGGVRASAKTRDKLSLKIDYVEVQTGTRVTSDLIIPFGRGGVV